MFKNLVSKITEFCKKIFTKDSREEELNRLGLYDL